MPTVRETRIIVSGTEWTVPNTWNNSNNTVICIGGGGGGGSSTSSLSGGGGGGARAQSNNLTLTPGANVFITIGAGGVPNTAGGYTSFNSGAVNAAAGSAGSADGTTGGAGGTVGSSTGNILYSGGNGGVKGTAYSGGGGGAGGNTGTGANGSAGTSTANGAGGAGGATDGGDGGASTGATSAGNIGWYGFDRGDQNAAWGSNYAGGGGSGGGMSSDKSGDTYWIGGNGGLFGGGGGGGESGASGNSSGTGGQGAIIVEWTWQSVLPSLPAQLSMSDINIALRDLPSNTSSLNDADVRGLADVPTGQISFFNFDDNHETVQVIATGSNGTSSTANSVTFQMVTGGAQVGDLIILTVNTRDSLPAYTGAIDGFITLGSALHEASTCRLTAFYKILEADDLNKSIVVSSNPSSKAWFQTAVWTVFRGPSKATIRSTLANDSGTTADLTGFTKSTSSKALYTVVSDRDLASDPTSPTGWTSNIRRTSNDRLQQDTAYLIPSRTYTNGSTITWTNLNSTYTQAAMVIELE